MSIIISKIALTLAIIIFTVNCKYLLINTTKFVSSFISRNSENSISSVSDFEYTVDIKNHIPKEDDNQIYGYNIHSNLYIICNSIPCNKYCDWQEHYIELDPGIEDQIDDMFETSPPKWVIIGTTRPMENEKLINRLSEKYEMIYSNDEYNLYRIK